MILNHGFLIVIRLFSLKLYCDKIILNQQDHLSIRYFSNKDFSNKILCNFCKSKLYDLIILSSNNNRLKIKVGYCQKCDTIQKKNILKLSKVWFKESWYSKHIERSKRGITPDYSIYKIFKKQIKSKSMILDIGCGNGDKLLGFKKKGYHVEGIDPSKGLVKVAKKYLKNVTCKTSENFLKSNSKKYDLIIFNDTLQFTQNPYFNIVKSLKLLKKDGYVYIKLGSLESKNLIQFSYQGLVLHILTVNTFLKNFNKQYKINILNNNPLQLTIQKKKTDVKVIKNNHYSLTHLKKKLFKDMKAFYLIFFKKIKINCNGRIFFLRRKELSYSLPIKIFHKKNQIPQFLK